MKKTFAIILTAVALTGCFNIKVKDGLLTVGDETVELASLKKIKGEGPAVKKIYEAEDFSSVKIVGAYDLVFTQGESSLVEIEAAENIHEYLDVQVVEGTLVLSTKEKVNVDNVKAYVTNPALSEIGINGAGNAEINGPLKSGYFNVEVNGAGDVSIKKLTCDNLDVKINGAGDLEAKDLDCGDLYIKINGAGDATLSGKAVNVNASINGVGEIDAEGLDVSGNFTKRIAGIGTVKRK